MEVEIILNYPRPQIAKYQIRDLSHASLPSGIPPVGLTIKEFLFTSDSEVSPFQK